MKLLFVCLGNICRSPLGEGIMKNLIDPSEFTVDSAGTSAYHENEAPDRRSIEIAKLHGIDISKQKSRKLTTDDFFSFDYIFAMDHSNLDNINKMKPKASKSNVVLLRSFDPVNTNADVPDPYYGGDSGFSSCYEMIERSCRQFLETIK